MERIEVRYKPVDMVPLFFHKYIVYTDSNGKRHLAEVQWDDRYLLAVSVNLEMVYTDTNGHQIQPIGTMRADIGNVDDAPAFAAKVDPDYPRI